MPSRGRRAASSYVPVRSGPKLTASKRIKAPAELDEDERAIFNSVLDSLPSDWFHECNKQLLVEYAIQINMRNHGVRQWKAARSANDFKLERELWRMCQDASKLIQILARSMRLAPSSVKARGVATHTDVAAPKRVWDGAEAA